MYSKKTNLFLIIAIIFIIYLSNPIFAIKIINNQNISNEQTYQEFKVYFIDVGQGDCIFIHTPSDYSILIDTGSRIYADRVIDFLKNIFVYTIDVFIATHPHEDHIGACQEIFDAFDILSVYHPGFPSNSATYQRFIKSAENEGCPIFTDENIDPGDMINVGGLTTCKILHINQNASNANDASIVTRFDYLSSSFLFTGDIAGNHGDNVESYLVDNWDVNVDFLKVTHHGSRYGSTDYFLREATPILSIISVGENNVYGHPHQEALDRLNQYSQDIFRTDINGNIAVITDGFDWNVLYDKPDDKPNTPKITGPSYGQVGEEYSFMVKTYDPNNDEIFYKWNWSDGSETDWLGPFSSGEEQYASHSWNENGAYVIKVKAKDINGHESSWGSLNVVMPKTKFVKKMMNFFKINSLYSLILHNLKNKNLIF